MGEVATRDYVRAELRDLLDDLVATLDRRDEPEEGEADL